MKEDKGFSKIVCLRFPPDTANRPLVCNLARLYDLCFNILKAQISPRQEGHMTIEIIGQEENYRRGMQYLKDIGVKVAAAAQQIFRDDASCIHCGVCTALCPTQALSLDRKTRLVDFDSEKCSTCGLCTNICPVKAMKVKLDNGQ